VETPAATVKRKVDPHDATRVVVSATVRMLPLLTLLVTTIVAGCSSAGSSDGGSGYWMEVAAAG
jgi:hypothetical protein